MVKMFWPPKKLFQVLATQAGILLRNSSWSCWSTMGHIIVHDCFLWRTATLSWHTDSQCSNRSLWLRPRMATCSCFTLRRSDDLWCVYIVLPRMFGMFVNLFCEICFWQGPYVYNNLNISHGYQTWYFGKWWIHRVRQLFSTSPAEKTETHM